MTNIRLLSFALILYCGSAVIKAAHYSPAITTTSGVIQGRLIHAGLHGVGLDVYEFIGIPYAEPPVGSRRFGKPIAKGISPGVLMATKTPDACPQLFGSIFPQKAADIFTPVQDTSEDCLYLNIWAPRQVLDNLYSSSAMSGTVYPWSSIFNSSLSPLAVMVWFHGGSYHSGSSMLPMFNGSVLAAYNNVIVVTVQFRLGALGFSYFGIDETPSNLGLLDQFEALKWVNLNIGALGGNSNRITLFGSDTGAASVTYHLISPYSAGYFQRAIIQSGSANAPTLFMTKKEALNRSMDLMNTLVAKSCPKTKLNATVQEKVKCLRSLDVEDILKYQDGVLKPDRAGSFGYFQIPFVPMIDGDFVPRNPRDMINDGEMNTNASVLIGMNKNEGAYFMIFSKKAILSFPTPLNPEKSLNDLLGEDFTNFISEYFAFYPRNSQTTETMLHKFIEMHYSCNNPLVGESVLQALATAVGDAFIACPLWEWGRAQANLSATFMYHFTHRPSTELWPKWMGVLHGDELPFVFGFPFSSFAQSALSYTSDEKLLSRRIMTYWTNFAKFGDPNVNDAGSPNGRLLPLATWPRFDNTRRIALELATHNNSMTADSLIPDFKRRDCTFWTEFFPDLVNMINAGKAGGAKLPLVVPPVADMAKVMVKAPSKTAQTAKQEIEEVPTEQYEYYD